jgi:hypothetical protein
MELEVDLRTQRATQEAKAFSATLEEMAAAVEAASGGLSRAEQAANNLAPAEEKAAASANKLKSEVKDAGDKARDAGGKFRDAGREMGEGMAMAEKGVSALTNTVTRWIQGYAGLRGVLEMLRTYQQYQQEIIDQQDNLVNKRLSQDELLRNVQGNLQLFGPTGQDQARQLVLGLQKDLRGGVSFNQAAALLSSAAGNQMDPRTTEGRAATLQLGKFAAIGGSDFGPAEIEGVSKLMAQQGVSGPKAVNDFLGRLFNVYTYSSTRNLSEFTRAATGALGTAKERGMGQDEAMGMLSGFLGTSRSAQAASEGMRMFLGMAGAPGKEQREFIAGEASRLGFTKVAGATEADAAGPDKEKLRDFDERIIRQKREMEEAREDRANLESTKTFRSIRDPIARAKAVREADDKLADAERNYANLTRDRAAAAEKAVAEANTTRQVEAYNQLPIQQSTRLMQAMFAAAKTPEDRARLMTGLGGQRRLNDVAALAASPEFARIQATATAKGGSAAGGALLSGAFEKQIGTSTFEAAAGAGAVSEADIAATDPGMLFADLASKQAEAQRNREAPDKSFWQMTGLSGDGQGAGALSMTAAGQTTRFMRNNVLAFIDRLWVAMTPAERTKYKDQINAIGQTFQGYADSYLPSTVQVEFRKALRQLGNIRAKMVEDRGKPGGGGNEAGIRDILLKDIPFSQSLDFKPFTDATAGGGNLSYVPGDGTYSEGGGGTLFNTRDESGRVSRQYIAPRGAATGGGGGATTRPSGPTTQPVSYNVQVGNYFAGDGPSEDLPGRLEGLA